jgi:hypothetical protein
MLKTPLKAPALLPLPPKQPASTRTLITPCCAARCSTHQKQGRAQAAATAAWMRWPGGRPHGWRELQRRRAAGSSAGDEEDAECFFSHEVMIESAEEDESYLMRGGGGGDVVSADGCAVMEANRTHLKAWNWLKPPGLSPSTE